jgi:malonyl-CoA decarboxylase
VAPQSLAKTLLPGFISVFRAGQDDRAARREAKDAIKLWASLLSIRGEVSNARIAADALKAYRALSEKALVPFFDFVAERFSPDSSSIRLAAEAYFQSESPLDLVALQRTVESPRQELFRRLNFAPDGISALLHMRRFVLAGLRDNPHWAAIEADLSHLLASWFNRGFLVLQRIDWSTSAKILEKLIQYEAVHEIHGWRDLRRRLEADRRCYAFFHPALPDEPLIFIEVALTHRMSATVQGLIDPDCPVFRPAQASCAIFYSITNCQEGLRGVSFGNLLIKQVVELLSAEFPKLATFATLSPVPGFRSWLERTLGSVPVDPVIERIVTALGTTDWHEDAAIARVLHPELMRLCAFYLLNAKKGDEPLDSVARFHLSNGARLERLNWLGDTSSRGMQRSAGLMVNYVYRLSDVEPNHQAYAEEHQVVASRRFGVLAKKAKVPSARAPSTRDTANAA